MIPEVRAGFAPFPDRECPRRIGPFWQVSERFRDAETQTRARMPDKKVITLAGDLLEPCRRFRLVAIDLP